MTLDIKPIKPKLISDQVFEQLRELIFRGDIQPGDKLMPERELAAALGVSRPTLRGAIHKLVMMGLLEQRQGQGTFVRTAGAKDNNPLAMVMESQNATVEDLLEVRMGLECNAAAYAAQRAVEKDLQFMRKSMEEMKTHVLNGGLGTEADVSFHMAISFASQNPVQIHIMRSMYDFLFVGINENLKRLYEKPGNIDIILRQHQAIYEAIRRHDPDCSLDAMRTHIQFVLNFFKEIAGSKEQMVKSP